MSNENRQFAGVRVCPISDVECSRGCGVGACIQEIHRAVRGGDDFEPVFPELQGQTDERVAFEAWAETLQFRAYSLEWDSTQNLYLSQKANIAWQAWQARATQQATLKDGAAHAVGAISALKSLNDLATQQATKGDERAASKCKRPGKCWIADRGIRCPRCDTPSTVAGSAGQAPEGWKLVPIKSTLDMDKAGFNALSGEDAKLIDAECCYNAMLAAAPTAPSLATDAGAELTNEQIKDLWLFRGWKDSYNTDGLIPQLIDFARAVLKKQKEQS